MTSQAMGVMVSMPKIVFNIVVPQSSSVRLAHVESIARDITKIANADVHPWMPQAALFEYPLPGMRHVVAKG